MLDFCRSEIVDKASLGFIDTALITVSSPLTQILPGVFTMFSAKFIPASAGFYPKVSKIT